jgi:hypothetical protein
VNERLSGRSLAAVLAVDEKAVRKAVIAGRISKGSDGKFDLEACRQAWGKRTDPARSKVADRADLKSPQSAVRTEDDARAAVTLIARILTTEGVDAGRIDFNAARTADTILKAYERDLDLQVRRGELVVVQDVGQAVEREYAVVRERLLAIPGKLASKLEGLDRTAIELVLLAEVTEALNELHSPASAGDLSHSA